MEALKRGDKVQVVHVYDPPSGGSGPSGTYEVILVEGSYVQLFGGKWPGTLRYHVTVSDLCNREIVLRPAHDAEKPGWGYSIRVCRVLGRGG